MTQYKTEDGYTFDLQDDGSLTDGDSVKVKPSLTSDGVLSYYDLGNDEIRTSKKFVLISTAGADSTILDAGRVIHKIHTPGR